jgi:hypothetical protein
MRVRSAGERCRCRRVPHMVALGMAEGQVFEHSCITELVGSPGLAQHAAGVRVLEEPE